MQELIRRGVVFVDAQASMETALTKMREGRISSVFVSYEGLVVGVISERDIVQKFSALDKKEKLSSPVQAFMSRPVHFARLAQLEEDVRRLFFQYNIRHFPITINSNQVEDIIGLITVTDITHAYLKGQRLRDDEKMPQIVVITDVPSQRSHYEELFTALKFEVESKGSFESLMQSAVNKVLPIVLDIDGSSVEVAKNRLSTLKSHPGIFIILSSHRELVSPLAKVLNNDLHFVCMKPLDIGHILRLLQSIRSDPSTS
jgi:CBS domain-containing protein